MDYIFKKGQANQPLLVLLHGTGGNEESLLAVAEFLNPEASILALRGRINENGALRFFKRQSEGHFDLEDLNQKAADLKRFLETFVAENSNHFQDLILVGFSNGANMAMHLMLQNNSPFQKGILMAPMYPLQTDHFTDDKKATSVFISMGQNDPLVSLKACQKVVTEFKNRNANIQEFWVNSHEVTFDCLKAAQAWLQEKQ